MGAIIVHHRHFPQVMTTVHAVLSSGVTADSIVIVDNSEDEVIAEGLRENAPDGMRVLVVPNHGYAAAVNAGWAELAGQAPEIVIVTTHEVLPEDGALSGLVDATRKDVSIGAAGPTLLLPPDGRGRDRIWSNGGRLSPVLGWPQHVQEESPTVTSREWLDGALVAYRSEALAESIREDFFMYVEELEFHRRLRSLGWNVVWVPAARATQDTQGAPPYLQARNLQIFYGAWGSWLQRSVSVPVLILRQLLVRILRRRSAVSATMTAIHGWRDGRRSVRAAVPTVVHPSRDPQVFRRY